MKRPVLFTATLLLLAHHAFGAAAPDPRREIDRRPGDIDAAIGYLEQMLEANYREDIFTSFTRGVRPIEAAHYAATRILALQRMGKLSVHSRAVRHAFSYEFNTARFDPTRLPEALDLYERFAVANTDDPFWRLIRARCAHLMGLPEMLQLYEQVAADMQGVPGDDEVRKAWEANREEFPIDDYTKEAWAKQTTMFVVDGKGPDVPGSPPIKGSPFPLIDIAGAVGSEAAKWTEALAGSALPHAEALDQLASECEKHRELAWRNGQGFLNTRRALSLHLLSRPAKELAALRRLQEERFKEASGRDSDGAKTLAMFRRFPWSQSAQRRLLQSARQHLFLGESQAAFRSFQDVLLHAEAMDLREQAQVGLWVSLAQFAEPAAVARSFDGVKPDATWPWSGKREKTDAIRKQLVKKEADAPQRPSLTSLRLHTIHLPPVPTGPIKQVVFSIDMQRDGDQLLVSSETMLAMYSATNPTKPLWSHTRRLHRDTSGSQQCLPRFDGRRIVARWGGDSVGDYRMLALNRTDGTLVSDGEAHDPYTRVMYRPIGSPVVVDNKVFTVQCAQSATLRARMHESSKYGDVALSCFQARGMAHQWTSIFDAARTTGIPLVQKSIAAQPCVREGAIYFCSNAGYVVRTDIRHGQMEWIHFFRPETGDNYRQPASSWCLGAAPIVTEDKVICMPKFTGRLFALDRRTGRRVWTLPMLRGQEVLGLHEDQVLVIAANSLYAIDVNTGEMRWGRAIAPEYVDGFQLPRAQLIGSSIYCGTKNALYRFDARTGLLLESRPWAMGNERPMSFLIDGTDLYVISDHPMRDKTRERQLAQYHILVYPAGEHRDLMRPVERKDGSVLIWRDCMLMCIKGDKVIWSRFVSNDSVYRSGMSERNKQISLSWGNASAVYDATTGALLSMSRSRPRNVIKIGAK